MSRVALNTEELLQLKWVLGGVLTLLAFWTLGALDLGTRALLLCMCGVIVAVLLRPALPARIPETVWRHAGPGLAAIIAIDFVLSGRDFLPPMLRMITFLAMLRCLQYRRRREDLQLVLLNLFIVTVAGVLSVSLLFALQILLFMPVAMVVLFLITVLESGGSPRTLDFENLQNFRWPHFARRVWEGLDLRMSGLAAALFLAAVLVGTVIFVSLPRFRLEAAVPLLKLQGRAESGFSESITFGDVTEIKESNAVSLRVEPPSRAALPRDLYWRMITLDRLEDGTFRNSVFDQPGRTRASRRLEIDARYHGRRPASAVEGLWNFYLEGNVSRFLPLLGPFAEMRFQKITEIKVAPDPFLYRLEEVPPNLFAYRVERMDTSGRLAAPADEVEVLRKLQAQQRSPRYGQPAGRIHYPETTLVLPSREEDRERLRAMVSEISGGRPLPLAEFIPRAVEHLRLRHAYSMKTARKPKAAGDPLVAWLQSREPGWCEHFAGSFALLARAAGWPSRVVAGFNGGAWNDIENYLVIRAKDAHAWVEVFDGEGAWLRVDPTPGATTVEGEPGEETGRGTLSRQVGWDAWLDSLRILWYRRVVNFDQQDQVEMTESLAQTSRSLLDSLQESLRSGGNRVREWLQQPWDFARALRVGAAAALLTALAWAARRFRFRLFCGASGGRAGESLDPVRAEAGAMLRRFERAWSEVRVLSILSPDQEAAWRSARADLLALRYGPLEGRPNLEHALAAAKKLIRSVPKLKRAATLPG